jgi:hypothetical protein
MERTTIPMVSADGIVTAEAIDSGVPGLVLAKTAGSEHWVLVHTASGLAVSRSAKHGDREVLTALAQRLAPLADWTRRAIPVPGPVLRREIDLVVEEVGLPTPSRSFPRTGRTWSAEQDRALLTRVLRRVHTSMPAGTFADAIGDLDTEERAHLRALLTDQPGETGAVLQSLPGGELQPPGEPRPTTAATDMTATHFLRPVAEQVGPEPTAAG